MRTIQSRISILLVMGLVFEGVVPPGLWARSQPAGEIRGIEVGEREWGVMVRVLGSHLENYNALMNESPSGTASKLFLTFFNSRLASEVERARAGSGILSRIDAAEVGGEDRRITEVVFTLSADASYSVQKLQGGVALEIRPKNRTASKPEPAMTASAPAPQANAVSEHTAIQSGDILYLAVSPADELSREVVVDQNGKISIPLLGAVRVVGLTAEQLAKTLTTGLERYVTNPKVDVLVKQSLGKQVSVVGQVNAPGVFTYRTNLRLLDLVSQAGGFSAGANKRQVRVLRGSGPERRVILVNVEEVLASGDVTKDFPLEPGDLVEVSKGSNGVTIFGEVVRPGSYDYVYDMRLLDLMSLCQGFKEGANLRKLTIFRGEAPHQTVFRVPFSNVLKNQMEANALLKPGDVVYVPQRSIWTASAFANALSPITAVALVGATILLAVKK